MEHVKTRTLIIFCAILIIVVPLFPVLSNNTKSQVLKKTITEKNIQNKNMHTDKKTYLWDIRKELSKKWPNNKTINIVFHGHSVPAGYFRTPTVKTFDSYPHLFHEILEQKYPYAVINIIVTAIGGENSISGAKRFDSEVLNHRPQVILIDYALNDRAVGLEKAKNAWAQMIEKAREQNIKVILLTPTIDINHKPGDSSEPLNLHAKQIRSLAQKYHIGLVDSLAALDNELKKGTSKQELLSNGYNHPSRKAHKIVANKISEWF